MSLHLSRALWYGVTTGLLILLLGFATYAVHSRSLYDALDAALVSSTVGVSDAARAAPTPEAFGTALTIPAVPDVITRAYGPQGQVLVGTPNSALAPVVDPTALSMHPAQPYDRIAALAPPFVRLNAGTGQFSIITDSAGARWRVYSLPITGSVSYLVSLAPLERVDASISAFRSLVALVAGFGVVVAFALGWVLSSRALRPVARLTATARAIARSRRLRERVPVDDRHDEMGQMAVTFNEMLDSIEQIHQRQQRFVADASHELRAPLTAIQANLELLQDQPAMPAAERREALGEASREVHRLARLVADLLALARADAGLPVVKERVDLDRVLLEALSEARHLARGQQIEVAALEPVLVVGSGDRLKQLLLLLLDNAFKYTARDGQITLQLRRTGQVAEIVIRDTGIGIPPEDLPHVFDRFYRADPARGRDPGGTGLGLPIARWIAEQHDGTVTLASRPGTGTTATVCLPTTQ